MKRTRLSKRNYDYYSDRVSRFGKEIINDWSAFYGPTESTLRARFKRFLIAYRAYRKFCRDIVRMERKRARLPSWRPR